MKRDCKSSRCHSPVACDGFGHCRERHMDIENIDAAMDLYARMDNLRQAGVNIRIAAMTNHYPAPNSVVIKAVRDEAIGAPL